MLIKAIKLFLRIVYTVASWTAVPFFKFCFRHSQWNNKPLEFARVALSDPDLVRVLTDSGQAHMLVQIRSQVEAMLAAPKPPTEEDREWGAFIQNYGANPQPDMVPEYFRYVIRGGTTGSTELPIAGAIVALCQHHAEEWTAWRKVPEFVKLFDQAVEWQHADPARAGWNDFYMMQWCVLRQDSIAAEIAERTKLPGMVGGTCAWMANSVAQQIPAFREALVRVGYDFAPPDMRAAVESDMGKEPFTSMRHAESAVHYPVSKDAANDFFQFLEGATVRYALVSVTEDSEGEELEHIEVVTSQGIFCVSAPDLGISFRKQKEPQC